MLKEHPEISGLINIGCYVMKPEFLEFIPKRVLLEWMMQ
jgi:NDP-sugar pyrophosphorylase family protein